MKVAEKEEQISLREFAKRNKLEMEVIQRTMLPVGHPAKFYARFKSCVVSDPPFLRSAFGNGENREEAIENYAQEIELKTIVVDASQQQNRRIQVPKLV